MHLFRRKISPLVAQYTCILFGYLMFVLIHSFRIITKKCKRTNRTFCNRKKKLSGNSHSGGTKLRVIFDFPQKEINEIERKKSTKRSTKEINKRNQRKRSTKAINERIYRMRFTKEINEKINKRDQRKKSTQE